MINTPASPRETPFMVILQSEYPTAAIAKMLNIRNVIPVMGITPPNKFILLFLLQKVYFLV